ncbi:MAG: response regulator [Isosphaeraceae bacterium]
MSDDGRGLDLRAIESKVRRVGLLGEDERPSAEKLRSLIFHPGFSTRAEANAIAGRGVGMDVVAREVGALKGSIELSTEPGKGTRLTIRLPARVALETTMIVRVDGQAFALPVAQIEHVQAMTGEVDGEGRPGEDGPSSGTVRFRDRPIPVLQAREILGVHATPAPSWPKLLVVRHGGGPVGLAVDAVEGTEDLVIKSLGSLLAGHPLISGTSLSLRGEVISILDPSRLHRWIRAASLPEEAPTAWTGIDSSIPDKPRILVVDDSISVRKSLAKGLQLFGFEVDEAADGLEAIGQTRAREYDLVVTDLEMPGLDGFELVAEMRRVATLAGVPVIVASTRSDEETRRRVLALGASRFLGKPVSAEALAGAVFEVLTPSGDRHGAEVAGAEEEPWTVP